MRVASQGSRSHLPLSLLLLLPPIQFVVRLVLLMLMLILVTTHDLPTQQLSTLDPLSALFGKGVFSLTHSSEYSPCVRSSAYLRILICTNLAVYLFYFHACVLIVHIRLSWRE